MDYFDPGVVFAVIPEFPNYGVTVDGRVYNLKTGRNMVLAHTAWGDPTVGMMKDGLQYRRSVKVLVAEAFAEGRSDSFNTPIQLDGNKQNLNVSNIVWRPRWFAWRFAQQFTQYFPDWYLDGPILDIINDVEYLTIIGAATTNGNLCEDILESIRKGTYVFPTGEKYVYI